MASVIEAMERMVENGDYRIRVCEEDQGLISMIYEEFSHKDRRWEEKMRIGCAVGEEARAVAKALSAVNEFYERNTP